jgi:hypothetical protein
MVHAGARSGRQDRPLAAAEGLVLTDASTTACSCWSGLRSAPIFRCYYCWVTSEIDTLQERVDAIRATCDPELTVRAYRALSKVLFEFTREKKRVRKFPIIKRVTVDDVQHFLSDLAEKASGRAR